MTYQKFLNSNGDPGISQLGINGYVATVVYDATLNGWLLFGGGQTECCGNTQGVGISNGVPPEVFIELCNEVGANPWFVELYLAADPMTDYTTQLASYVKANFPSMVPEFEICNELWNGGNECTAYSYAKVKAYAIADPQYATANGAVPATTCPCTITLNSLPGGLAVGSPVYDVTNRSIGALATITSIDVRAKQIAISGGIFNQGISNGDTIAFSWAAVLNGFDPFGSAWADDYAGKQASTLGQAVSAVYGGDTSRYKIIVGINTNGEGRSPTEASSRLLSSAYVGQNASNIPVQSGCAGASSVQTNCPTQFLQEPAYKVVTNITPQNYWQPGELGWQQEVIDAYDYFYGNSSQRTAIMERFFATSSNRYVLDTIGNFSDVLYPAIYAWAKSCAGAGSENCPQMQGLVFYEGSYAVQYVGAGNNVPQNNDYTITIKSATNGNPCVLNTTSTFTASYINDGKNFANGVAGNTLSVNQTPSAPIYFGSQLSGAGVRSETIIQGGGGPAGGGAGAGGYQVTPSQYVAPTTLSSSANGAVAGMQVAITGARGGTWSSINGNVYTVQSSGLSQSAIPLNLDCSSLGALGQLTLTYIGSMNYINFLRAMSFEDTVNQTNYFRTMYSNAAKFGGGGASQLDIASPVSPLTAWSFTGNNIFGYFNVGQSTGSTISGTRLTLGGVKVPVTSGTYNPSTGMVVLTLGASSYALLSGPVTVSNTSGTGADLSSVNGNVIGYVSGSTLSYATSPGLRISSITGAAVAQVTGQFQPGQYIQGPGIQQGITITAIASGTGIYPGDTLILSSSPGTLSSRWVYGMMYGTSTTLPGMFPSFDGAATYNSALSYR